MSGEEIIKRLKVIKQDVWNVDLKDANIKIDYLIDDIFMYKNIDGGFCANILYFLRLQGGN